MRLLWLLVGPRLEISSFANDERKREKLMITTRNQRTALDIKLTGLSGLVYFLMMRSNSFSISGPRF